MKSKSALSYNPCQLGTIYSRVLYPLKRNWTLTLTLIHLNLTLNHRTLSHLTLNHLTQTHMTLDYLT
jgi:hypothetical protein